MKERIEREIERVGNEYGVRVGERLEERLLRLEKLGKEIESVKAYVFEGKEKEIGYAGRRGYGRGFWKRGVVKVVGEVGLRRWFWYGGRWCNSR